MSALIRADITPSTVSWAIQYSNIDRELLSRKVGVKSQKINSWESGEEKPTLNQLYKLAKVCDVPVSLFFFENPPDDIPLAVNDFRKIYSSYGNSDISYELTLEIRNARRIQKLAFEVFEEIEIQPPQFSFWINPQETDENIAKSIRNYLDVSYEEQHNWRDKRVGFNNWREALENKGIIVLQSTNVEVSEMRGFSISGTSLPVIVVNRKDEYSARTFSLLHEFIHIATNTSGLCDLLYQNHIEAYCNRLAAETLMPKENFLLEVNKTILFKDNPSDYEIGSLSNKFSVSKISVLRHLLTYDFITPNFYQEKQFQYQKDYEQNQAKRKESNGFLIKRSATDIISQNGKFYPSLIMDAYFENKITKHDLFSMLNIKSRHLDDLFVKLSKK